MTMPTSTRRGPRATIALLTTLLVAVACTGSTVRPPRRGNGSATRAANARATEQKASARGPWFYAACDLPSTHLRRIRRGYVPGRSPDVIMVPRKPNFFGGFTITTHAGPWGYLQAVPLVFYGPGFIAARGELTPDRRVTVADVAPTLAQLLGLRWPADRPGRPLREVLEPAASRAEDLRMILTVVWDGGGYNVLDAWPQAWPRLGALMRRGASVGNAAVGSSPSVTPAIHATIGTGAYPKQHQVTDIPVRVNGEIENAFGGMSPEHLRLPTLGDLYDRATNNRAQVGLLAEKSWHLGMLGHGAYADGGDKDIAVMWTKGERLVTNPSYYSLPSYLKDVGGIEQAARRVDLDDGHADGAWMNHLLADASKRRLSPVWGLYQTKLLKKLFTRERFGRDRTTDLFFTNYKDIDLVGHVYNMLNPEMRSTISYSDEALGELVDYLDRHVGRRKWVLVLTADHGQGPDPARVGAWPIGIEPLEEDIADHFGVDAKELFVDERPTGLWLDREFAAGRGISPERVSSYLLGYRLKDNVAPGDVIPTDYRERERERLFTAAFPAARLGEVWACARERLRDSRIRRSPSKTRGDR
jgi:arylsulfatase A-like enzyme